jgi:hypothetical protein
VVSHNISRKEKAAGAHRSGGFFRVGMVIAAG